MASKLTKTPYDLADTGAMDAEILAGCRAGDQAARQQLYELCHRRVYRLMVRMVGVQDAADLTQQVFLQVFRKLDKFSGRSKFETWMYRLAVNEALQHLRKGKRWRWQTLGFEPASCQPADTDRCERQELLDRALSRIEPELRSIFVLREVEGLSYVEIAEAMDIPSGTVGSRLNRARHELQKHLIDFGWEP